MKLKRANDSQYKNIISKAKIIEDAAKHYAKFMEALGLPTEGDPHSEDTPTRVAKSFVNDLIEGCYARSPKMTAFDNTDGYDGMVFEGNIDLKSLCSHHHLPFIGKAHVAYIPSSDGKVIGLSKLNRIVEYYARRPQVQESLTMQIVKHIDKVCEYNRGVAVVIEADHMCACIRGVRHDSTMMTAKMTGVFMDNENLARSEFYSFVNKLK